MGTTHGWLIYAKYQAMALVLAIVGIPVIAIACTLRAWKVGMSTAPWNFGKVICYHWRWSWMDVWDNEENGICGSANVSWWSVFYWSALRNPVDNLRFIMLDAFWVIPAGTTTTVEYRSWGYIVTAGWRQCVTITGIVRFGWLMDDTAAPGYRVWPVLERA